MCITYGPRAHGGQKRTLDPLELEAIVWPHGHEVSGNQLRSFARAASTLNLSLPLGYQKFSLLIKCDFCIFARILDILDFLR